MALSRLSLDNEKYEIFISNEDNEFNKNRDDISTASDFQAIIDPALDIAPLLYLKSSNAELSLNQFFLDNLCLTFTKTESMSFYVAVPLSSAICNEYVRDTQVKTLNDQPYIFHLDDFSTTSPQEVVTYLNDKFCESSTYFLLRSYLRVVLDIDVFKPEVVSNVLTLKDIKLLLRYLDIAIYSRYIAYCHLVRGLKAKNTLSDHEVYSFSENEQKIMTARWESNIIAESNCILPVNERHAANAPRMVNLAGYPAVCLQNNREEDNSHRLAVTTQVQNFLSITTYDDDFEPTDKTTEFMEQMVVGNEELIKLALKSRQILEHEGRRIDKRVKNLFHDFLITFKMDVDNSKLKVDLNPTLFLTNTKAVLALPEQVSYVLGGRNGHSVVIGPITSDSDSTPQRTSLTHRITASEHRLFSGIRPHPKVLHVLNDLTGDLGKDQWLRRTPHESYSIIHTILIDDAMISTRFISKLNDTQIFHRTSNAKKIINGFKIRLVDNCFRTVIFPVCTIVKLSFTMRPVLHENF